MPARIDCLKTGRGNDSSAISQLGKRNRSALSGLDQAPRDFFFHACGLPTAWSGQSQWCILQTSFAHGLNFLVAWAAWKADLKRPRLLHFVSLQTCPINADDLLRTICAHDELAPLAEQLNRQLWGLLPGMHRLVFESGQVLLTLCIGDAKTKLRQAAFSADSVYLDGSSPLLNPDTRDIYILKAVARCCRLGSNIATWALAHNACEALVQCGFVMNKSPGPSRQHNNLHGTYQPAWKPKKTGTKSTPSASLAPARCVVVGSGLAGAAVAASLARRGWQVTVLDAASAPAAGASSLPAGVLAPHVSPDDNLLSRLSRSGIRSTLQQAEALLQTGSDWQLTGVLERGLERIRQLPAAWWPGQALAGAANDWIALATPAQLDHAGLSPETSALWHVKAGWIKPASLIKAWLATPGVTWRGRSVVGKLVRLKDTWQLLDSANQELASAELVVLAAGHRSNALADHAGLANTLALQAIRGQISWAMQSLSLSNALPPFPINGHGNLVPAVPLAEGVAWMSGSTFDRDSTSLEIRLEDTQRNFSKLQTLLPAVAQALAPSFMTGQVQSWAGIRCATPSRLPVLGPLENLPGVWVCTGMGSRGLSFAALCGELLAARLHGEPLPVEQRLADALLPQHVVGAAGGG